jgi:hypothetical protein
VMKNWDLLVSGPELAMATIPLALNLSEHYRCSIRNESTENDLMNGYL